MGQVEKMTTNAGEHFRPTTICEVARLAEEAARLIQALYMVVPVEDRPEYAEAWPSAFEEIDANRSVTPREIWDILRGRIKAIEEFTPTRVATSRKGALFQLYLAGAASRTIAPDVGGFDMPLAAKKQVDASIVRLTSLVRGALSALEASGDLDDDLRILRRYFFNPDVDAEEHGDFLLDRVDQQRRSA